MFYENILFFYHFSIGEKNSFLIYKHFICVAVCSLSLCFCTIVPMDNPSLSVRTVVDRRLCAADKVCTIIHVGAFRYETMGWRKLSHRFSSLYPKPLIIYIVHRWHVIINSAFHTMHPRLSSDVRPLQFIRSTKSTHQFILQTLNFIVHCTIHHHRRDNPRVNK